MDVERKRVTFFLDAERMGPGAEAGFIAPQLKAIFSDRALLLLFAATFCPRKNLFPVWSGDSTLHGGERIAVCKIIFFSGMNTSPLFLSFLFLSLVDSAGG